MYNTFDDRPKWFLLQIAKLFFFSSLDEVINYQSNDIDSGESEKLNLFFFSYIITQDSALIRK